ncbi:MAG: S1 RNA-binding domain-containing protein [Elusimicrobiaceae bacterium]|nr:S1 RNA-binding domain-containing protein [Elusimicrobiaceae bacterium]MBR2504585.1 S1 RNA-binding domain-containing protein [Elusimicrobiaceae bacterium]
MNEEIKTTEEINEAEMTMDQLIAQQESLSEQLNKREIVEVTVVQISGDYILVDTGAKKEGAILVSEFDGKTLPAVGEKVSAVLVKRGSDERHSILSHKKALEMKGWDLCKAAYESKERVKGVILQTVKGGYIVEVLGVSGFMPLSLSELHTAYKHYLPVGAKIKAVIVEFSKEKQKLIVSRKQVLEEDEAVRRTEVLGQIKEGEILRVVVAKVDKERLFLRFHGIEGIVTLENIAWKEPETAIANFRRGQRLKAKLLKLDKETPRLEFGLKQLFLNPADALKRRYPYKSSVKAKIEKISEEEGVECTIGKNNTKAFISPFEMGREFTANVGDVITALVVGVNPETFTVNLSVKKYDQAQNRKVVAQYLKQAPRPTLGQLLEDSFKTEETETEEN